LDAGELVTAGGLQTVMTAAELSALPGEQPFVARTQYVVVVSGVTLRVPLVDEDPSGLLVSPTLPRYH
jgi:hypothetical protein